MSIVKMKLVSVIGPLADFDNVVRRHIVNHDFHAENALTVMKNVKGLLPFDTANPYSDALGRALAVMRRLGIGCEYREFRHSADSPASVAAKADELTLALDKFDERKSELERTLSDDRQIILQLAHMTSISANLDDLMGFNYTGFRFGRLPRDYYAAFRRHIDQNDMVFFMPTGQESEFVYGLYMVPRRFAENIDALFASLHFELINLPTNAHGTPEEATSKLEAEIARCEDELKSIEEERKALADNSRDELLRGYSFLRFSADTYAFRRFAAHSADAFYLIGWVPSDKLAEFTSGISEEPGVSVTSDDPDTHGERDGESPAITPPTKLRTAVPFRPFRSFLSVYGTPDYGELDPTPFLAMTYPVLFGIMFGDLGQGLVLALGAFAVFKLKKMRSALIFMISGLFSAMFGFIYGSFFGNEEVIGEWLGIPGFGFHVLQSSDITNETLLIAVGLGVTLLSIAIVLNMINGAKQHDFRKMIFSASGLCGLVLYWAALGAVADGVMLHIGFATPVYIICLIVLPVVLIFLGEPLGDLCAGKKDWLPAKKGEYAIVSFFELFEVAVSFLSNTVSFIRVGAFALSHAGMMLVVNTISAMTGESGNIFVIIFGNLFVMALEGLIVGIQVLRLEFYELFNRFYSGSGKEYRTFTIDYSNGERVQ